MRKLSAVLAAFCLILITGAFGIAEDAPAAAPVGEKGLAAKYQGDVGIDQDAAVLFTENFEAATIDEMAKRYTDFKRKNGNMKISNDVPPGSSGKQSISMYGNHMYMHPKPVDQMYARYYQRWSLKTGYTHHHPFIIAESEPTPWPNGFAGKKPDGAKFFGACIDAWGGFGGVPPPGKFITYSYWHEMTPDGRGDYWGKNQQCEPETTIEPGRWYCVEHMIKANTAPDSRDGEQALWIDGVKLIHVKDRSWRTSNDLKINAFWLLHDNNTADLNKDTNPDRTYDENFDDVVLATEYIGPIEPSKAAKPAQTPAQ
jgi:hypothetical protein